MPILEFKCSNGHSSEVIMTFAQAETAKTAGGARVLFDSHSYGVFGRYDASADGQRFVVVYEGNRPSSTLTSVVNWTADLKEH